jgi:phospholipid/cholesterol/gamma-HCH transport system ATP-binding protein
MIIVRDAYKSFNGNQVLKGLNLEILEGEMFALIGRSGLGKSVLLKHIIGIMKPDRGDIFVDDQDVRSLRGKQLEAMRRKFGYLFQEGALFDSMTVFENIAFPLREKTAMKEPEIKERVFVELEHMGLKNDFHKYPAELSGGMRKRTSLARAMIMQPSIMLFDEPTTGLDPIIGQSILNYIQLCHRRLGFTGIIVTHDVPRVFSIVQKIAMMDDGRIIINGTYDEIVGQGNTAFQQFLSGSIEGPLHYV